MINKKIYSIICVLFILLVGISIVSANDNITEDTYQNDNTQKNYKQNTEYDENSEINTQQSVNSKSYSQNITEDNDAGVKTATANNQESLTLNVSVINKTVALVSDAGSEVAIRKNITTVNGKPDVTKLGTDYAYVDENGTYTIEGSEIRRVMRLDSLCQQIYGFVPKYTFFRAIGSNVKYVISREKWNVIARSLNGYHVNKGYNAVNTPYSVTVNLTGKSRYYNVYYDAQEWINGHQYTCGPTAMSMISQALNCYASEKRLAGLYSTTSSEGTGESSIIRNSPTAHMKLTDITDSKTSVKNALITGKVVFWHIRGHYMCIIGYNSVTDKFLCLNPSGPSHNINAVQWATWTQVMNTDRGLKEKGFMSVKPCWDLTTSNKTNAKYYYYNMGGKYTVPPNNEYCNGGYDNKVKVVADAPANIPKTTKQAVLKINSKVTVNNGEILLYVDTKVIKRADVHNGIVSVNYTLPAYTPNNITITSKYLNSSGGTVCKVKISLDKNIVGKYSKTNTFKSFEQLTIDDVVAKKGDIVTFTANIKELDESVVNNGKVVFKLNGNTLKRNGSPIKVNVVKGVAKLNFIIPSYSAKKYKLTAVFGNNTHRFETDATLTINKLNTKIDDLTFTQKDSVGILTARIVDEKGDIVERDTKISIKIDGKTVVNKVKISKGLLNRTLNLSRYANGKHTILVIAGENGLYKTSRINKTVIINSEEVTQSKISISNLDLAVENDVVNVRADITTADGVNIEDNVKLSVKIDGKTVVNKAIVSEGIINKSLDVSGYAVGVHSISLIVGETKLYESCVLNNTFSLS